MRGIRTRINGLFRRLKLYRPLLCRWNKKQISNWSSVGYLKRVQFYNWFRLHWLILRVRMLGVCACAYLTSVNQALLIVTGSCASQEEAKRRSEALRLSVLQAYEEAQQVGSYYSTIIIAIVICMCSALYINTSKTALLRLQRKF